MQSPAETPGHTSMPQTHCSGPSVILGWLVQDGSTDNTWSDFLALAHLSLYCAHSLEFSHVMTLSWKSEIMSVLNKAEGCQCSVVLLIGCEINHWVCFLALALDSKNKIGHLHLSLGKISKNKSYGNYASDVERGMGNVSGISKKCQQLEAAFWDMPLRYDIFLCVSQD